MIVKMTVPHVSIAWKEEGGSTINTGRSDGDLANWSVEAVWTANIKGRDEGF
jgi:hypothetical protein